ncbi:MAG: hypothetical protein SFU25_09475 [Candidatus Caenarcaniphilales bacterium]|nr:hypothetical protein [Candidatus Caenarcaniphilales bacterium]
MRAVPQALHSQAKSKTMKSSPKYMRSDSASVHKSGRLHSPDGAGNAYKALKAFFFNG